jgi:nicotinate-nucleotide--dimethylbenzimidazole phosphoribosyltransferase
MLSSETIWNHLDQLTKPPRSLGRLEELAARLCEIQQTLRPQVAPRRLVLFAGDHGVVASGVTAWPAEVTGLMIDNILRGGAASSVLSKQTNTELELIDVGSIVSVSPAKPAGAGIRFEEARVRSGTRNLALEPALTVEEFEQARRRGGDCAKRAVADGVRVVACGEMGIGNTTPAACLSMLLADVPLEYAVGRGAGSDDRVLQQKRGVVKEAVIRARGLLETDELTAIASVSGLEIAAMAGFWGAAAKAGLTLILDGYVVTAAALIAERLAPGTVRQMLAAHLSAEPGHRLALDHLGLSPFLEWEMRLGEGTGALLLMPLLDCAAALSSTMATFADLGIEAGVKP